MAEPIPLCPALRIKRVDIIVGNIQGNMFNLRAEGFQPKTGTAGRGRLSIGVCSSRFGGGKKKVEVEVESLSCRSYWSRS
jgi:hypothetical protein